MPTACDDAIAAEAAPRWSVSWSAMSAVKAADATATPTETPTHATPTPHGPCANAIPTSERAPSTTPPSAHGRRRPNAPRARSLSPPASGPAMTPARPPTASTSPEDTTPAIQPSASSGMSSCNGINSCRGVSCAVQSASHARLNRVNQRAPTRCGAATVSARSFAAAGRSAGGRSGTVDPFVEDATGRVPAVRSCRTPGIRRRHGAPANPRSRRRRGSPRASTPGRPDWRGRAPTW